MSRIQAHNIRRLVVIGTDCTGSCKSSYHMITTTMTPNIYNFIAIEIHVTSHRLKSSDYFLHVSLNYEYFALS